MAIINLIYLETIPLDLENSMEFIRCIIVLQVMAVYLQETLKSPTHFTLFLKEQKYLSRTFKALNTRE